MLVIAEEVQEALHEKKPIVALESTIISHGMPYPQNVETALDVEKTVREAGAIPATIALFDGKMHVGLQTEDINRLGSQGDVQKVSIRDMALVLSQGKTGSTTVSATMRIASMAGIALFATGGIGGVHRGAESSMDISNDLMEMAKTNVAVVSAGVKSILDIGRTLEFLETLGVPVVTVGSDQFPSFYSSTSGFKSPFRLDDETEIASMLHAKWRAGLEGSVLIACPLPAAYDIPASQMEGVIQEALRAANTAHVSGKAITPFLLKFIADHTEGESLKANISLIKNNAALAARIAIAYHAT